MFDWSKADLLPREHAPIEERVRRLEAWSDSIAAHLAWKEKHRE